MADAQSMLSVLKLLRLLRVLKLVKSLPQLQVMTIVHVSENRSFVRTLDAYVAQGYLEEC